MIGSRFGRLLVEAENGARWTVRCDCGTVKEVRRKEVLRKTKKPLRSCGCLQREAAARIGRERNRVHGMKGTPTWKSWQAARNRCRNPNNVAFANYGGRGIKFCERWDDFAQFVADVGERPEGTTLDRIDNAGHYEPGNCRWSTPRTQARNKRDNRLVTYGGRTITVAQAADSLGMDRSTLGYRLRAGWPVEMALTTPVSRSNQHIRRTAKPRS